MHTNLWLPMELKIIDFMGMVGKERYKPKLGGYKK
jgi:hypothetical protein